MSDVSTLPDAVLVVVPVRDRPHLVRKTLDTVAAQTRPPAELVVVDDGSTDDGATPEAVEAWIRERAASFPARVLRREHAGISTARNAGLAAGRPARWVAFLDSDDLWPVDFLARCLAAVESRPDAVAVTADQRFVDGATGEAHHQDASGLEDEPGNWLLQNEPALCSSSLLRVDLVRAGGGFDPRQFTGEDIGVLFPLILQGPWCHAPGEPVVYQRGTPGGEAMNNSRRFEDRFRRWAHIYDELLLRPAIRARVDPTVRAQRLWFYWFEAGEELFRAHDRREARGCFARALAYRKHHRKTWSRWAKCRLSR